MKPLYSIGLIALLFVSNVYGNCDYESLVGDWTIYRTTTTYPEMHLVFDDIVEIEYEQASDVYSVQTKDSKWTVVNVKGSHVCEKETVILEFAIQNKHGCKHQMFAREPFGYEKVENAQGKIPANVILFVYGKHSGCSGEGKHTGSHDDSDPGHSHGYD